MAKKISQLTQATEVKSDDVTVIVQDGETKKLPLNMMVTKQDIENKKIAGLAKLDEIEATYENDTYTPTITVKNKSSVKVGEGDGVDYSANVMDGHVKSAILKGQTLVNLIGEKHEYVNPGASKPLYGWEFMLPYKLTSGKTYLAIFDISGTFVESNAKVFLMDNGFNSEAGNTSSTVPTFSLGHNVVKCIATNDIHKVLRIRTTYNENEKFTVSNVMLIEYQEGMENWDIPYFEGMQSVKMPVLTTTGKNLFDVNKGFATVWQCSYTIGSDGSITIKPTSTSGVSYIVTETIELEVGKTYRLTWNETGNTRTSYMWLEGTTNGGVYNINKPFTVQEGKNRVRLAMYVDNTSLNNTVTFKPLLEQGTSATTYEPYKTNILTVNEPVELRGIGDVQDTLNCLTGEVTERIGERIFDGSSDENWRIYSTYTNNYRTAFIVGRGEIPSGCRLISNQYEGTIGKKADDTLTNYLYTGSNNLNVFTKPNITLEEFRNYLQENPLIVQYQLSTETIKTVDLMPSGTHPSTTPYCWKNGLIQLSSSGLLPNLEYSVVTSRAGQINQNATMIVKNDKRIFDLEILLAGGLVNTTYQALTLQNQVETGLSKVSLNSETEPDYLLYHMIMKLIEEKAYKLDDLTEKVSVFYLYEKLSDEQFETIYSALYPFVEDEIVEEPVVEELPEVVEDEVIM